MNKPRVLVAGTTPAIERVREVLGREVDTIAARSMREALQRLESHPDLIVCNVRFDESRMLDLLQVAKTSPVTRDTPFVCFHVRHAPAEWLHSIEVAVLAVGAAAFVDLSSLREAVFSHLPH